MLIECEYDVGWKNRCVVVNGNEYRLMFDCMKSRLVEFKNNNESDRIEIIKNIVKEISLSSYDDEHYSVVDDNDDDDNYEYNIQSFKIMNLLNDFENYLKKPSQYIRNESINFRVINKLFESISIDIKHSIVNNYVLHYTSSLCFASQILDNTEYDESIKEWCGDYKWKLLYRASEYGYTARSFHECCNNKEPTMVIIKSSGGWIFGGYTTKSWSGDSIYNRMIHSNQ